MPRPLLALLLPVLPMAACPTDPCAPPKSDGDTEIVDPDVVFGGDGNDEVWLTMYDAKERASSTGDVAVTVVPTEGQVFAASDAPPTFEWSSPLKLALGPHPAQPLWPRVPRSPLDTLTRALIPSARAHEPPVTSDVYLVELAALPRQCPRSIVTSELRHTLDADTWAALKDVPGEDQTISIYSAFLTNGVITEGPFVAAPVTFRVE